jgi:hypothetical protein
VNPTIIVTPARDDDEIALERLAALIRRIDPIPESVTAAAREVFVPDAGIDVSKLGDSPLCCRRTIHERDEKP